MDLEVSIQPLFAIMKLTEKIKMAIIEKNEFMIGIFLDLSTAFDTINHNILLQKLGFYGIRGLCNGSEIKYNSTYSENKSIKCGVPPGSALGPLLFLLFIYDIHACSNLLSFILFVDDTNLFISGN